MPFENADKNRIKYFDKKPEMDHGPGMSHKKPGKMHGPGDYHNGPKNMKPDFLDLDKDGDKKESMKKAAKDKKLKESGGGPNMSKMGSKEVNTVSNFRAETEAMMYKSSMYGSHKKD